VRTVLSLALLLALSGCQWGQPPRIPYVDGTTYVTPDGRRTPIQGQQKIGVSAVLPYADGLLVADTRWFEGSVGLAHVRGNERTELGPCSTGGGVPSADRTRVAWLTLGCPESLELAVAAVHVADADGSDGWSRELDRQSLLFVVGFLGDAVVVDGWLDPIRVVPEEGPITEVPHLRHAVDVHGTLVAGSQGVVDTASGALLWHDPRAELGSFSPDGRLLFGAQRGENVLFDARTGEVVATLPRRIYPTVWEDDRHLLAVAYGKEREAMMRIGLDGRAELVGPVRDARPYGYTFETQP
jgi:hypothetical protein